MHETRNCHVLESVIEQSQRAAFRNGPNNMNRFFVAAISFLLAIAGVEASEPRPYAMPRTEVAPITDSETGRRYALFVKLPEGYADDAGARYPVIYTTDALWHMDMLSGATEYLMPNAILVGISWQTDLGAENAHASRFRDYTVLAFANPDIQARYQGGQAAQHLNFIRNDVFEFIDDHYRTKPGARTYFGYSLGGQFGAYALFAAPDAFNTYVLGSPALSERSLAYLAALEAEKAPAQGDPDVNVFVSIGELETDEMRITEEFMSLLQRRRQTGIALTGLEIIADSDHGAAFPETAIRGVKWLSKLNAE